MFRDELAAALRDLGITPPPHGVNTGLQLATLLMARLPYDVDALIREVEAARRRVIVIDGYVRDAGGGEVVVIVSRETPEYPPKGADVTMLIRDQ